MNTKAFILARLESLIDRADVVLATHTPDPPNVIGFPTLNFEAFSEWRTQSLVFLTNIFGTGHVYVQHFSEGVDEPYISHVSVGKGILKGAHEDVKGNYLNRVEDLVSADIFSDFLEMAEYLAQQGYKDPAASLIGAVLENGLRRIASVGGIKARTKEDISSLNHKLADAKTYNRLTQKIQVWGDIRNNADHGRFNEYESQDVAEMIAGVQGFLEQYLGKTVGLS